MKSNFADNIKKIRKDNNLSQEQLADMLGVSRQSVSKWESQSAYPEMDKVIQICRLFNLNVDELLNQNISNIKEQKEEKNRINKYIDDILSYITKTAKLFSSLKFKNKIKCICEQIIIALILSIVFTIIGSLFSSALDGIFSLFPDKIYNVIMNIFCSIYLILCIILAIVIIIHLFKVRYLDYYEFIDENSENEKDNTNMPEYNKIIDNHERIIIRDPKHSEYRFVNGLIKCFIFILKCILWYIFIILSCTLLFLTIFLIISLYHILYHNIFIGSSISIFGLLIINILVLIIIYSLIFNKDIPFKYLFIIFLGSIVITGMGCAWCFISSLNIKYDNKKYVYKNQNNLIKEFKYDSNTDIYSYHDSYTFLVDNSKTNTVQIKFYYNKEISTANITDISNHIVIDYDSYYNNFTNVYKRVMKDLKNNNLYNYESSNPEVVIITSEDNIKEIIMKKTKKRLSTLEIRDNKYYLELIDEYSDENLCYVQDGYYNKCISLNLDSDIKSSSFSYDSNGLHYDESKYTCSFDDKWYDCEDKSD